MKHLILLGMVLTTLHRTAGETEHHLSSIFLTGMYTSYCQLDCPGATKHTLCELPSDPKPEQCENFQQLLGSSELWQNILNAHNGIRNRYAMRRRITNMKKLVWDDELARMARLHLATCQRYEPDPCAQLSNANVYSRDYRNVRQSKAFVIERYLPKYYAIDVLRSWYLQKDETPAPQVTAAHQLQHTVLNNFTLLTWASLERIGCAAAKYRDGFQLVCNYFPYYSLAEPAAELGPPATRCPRTFPLRSSIFDGLCTFEMDGAAGWKLANLALVPLGLLCLWRTGEGLVLGG
ncbi:venom allergen 5-like [Anopheles stephensi]|uniref:venom allergen 5-like n=1 Tax=Anopheles stephensi TaxID=30069 RepID=UPI0016588440|nr:venom allergen 5-like [Anopheles stephensi]